YEYRDEQGTLLFLNERFTQPDGRKSFAPHQPGQGKGQWSIKGVRRVLYRLPELVRAPRDAWIYVVEGEKDSDRLASLGLVATTNIGGAEQWTKEHAEEYTRTLVDRKVVICGDNDDAGRRHVAKVVHSLAPVAAELKVLPLGGLPPKGD